ncbi:MAG TPA: NAD(P)H-dependent oxidoreductase [Caulobacteraceae bacterium]|nr:NAD(P)H-dependent oxidoreductase [Caulobacteraceae bacterium]
MKHAVVVAHPSSKSFNLTMAATYLEAAKAEGHDVLLRDLYRMGFNPCLAESELPGARSRVADDVVAERAILQGVDVFCFVYPLWFDMPPAMLKGYLERVFGGGFGYAFGDLGNTPLLRGKRMISVSSSGAPTSWVRETGDWSALATLFDGHFAEVCGLTVVGHVHFGDITPGITEAAVRSCREEVETAVRRHFGRQVAPAA